MQTICLTVGHLLLDHPLPFLIFAFLINLMALILYGTDKYKAKRHGWRIPEATLLMFSVLGGSIGSILGMWFFRHKTKHKMFLIAVPVCFVIYSVFLSFSLFLTLLSSYGA